MKKLLAGLLAVLLLSGCTTPSSLPTGAATDISTLAAPVTEPTTPEPTTTEPLPVYDAAPAVSDRLLTIQGTALPQCYEVNAIVYIALNDFTEASHMATVENADSSFTCTFHHVENEFSLTNGSTKMHYAGKQYSLPAAALYDGKQWYAPAEALLSACGYTQYDDTEQNHLYYTVLFDPETLPEDYDVPCLMYHAVSDDCWGIQELFVSPEELDKQLLYLKENGYTTITFEDLPHIAEIEKPVLLTFDDGYDDNYQYLYPLLQKYSQKATIFCIGNAFGRTHKLTAEQIKEMSDSGLVSIQSHTMTHPDLDTLNEATQRWELSQSQLELLRVTGKQPFVLCYPTGRYNSTTISLAKEYYTYGILMSRGSLVTGKDPFYIGRRYISRYTDISNFANYLP